MTIEEFLRENAYNLSAEEYNEAVENLEKMDKKSWIKKYAPLMEAKTAGWLDVEDVKKAKDLSSRLREAFGSSDNKNVFDRPSNYINEVYYKEFEDVPRDQFDEALGKMRQYAQEGIDARREEAGRKRREQEVKNWNSSKRGLLRNLLASDYEKQRYIDNPSAAIFGEEATPVFGKDWLGKGEAISDLAYGVAGAAGDFITGPTKGLLAKNWVLRNALPYGGSLARTMRDLQHKGTIPTFEPSKYQKDWSDIAMNTIMDAGIVAGAERLKNFRKAQRVLSPNKEPIDRIIDLEREANNIEQGADALLNINRGKGASPTAALLQNMTPEEAASMFKIPGKTIDDQVRYFKDVIYPNMPDSELKRKLSSYMKNPNMGIKDLDDIKQLAIEYSGWADLAKTPEGRIKFRDLLGGNKNVSIATTEGLKPVTELTDFMDNIRSAPTLSPSERYIGKPLTKAAREFLAGSSSNAVVKSSANVTKMNRPKGEAERVETPEERAQIEEIKKQEARFWEAGFKPNKNEKDPLWRAYEEWYEENKRGEE